MVMRGLVSGPYLRRFVPLNAQRCCCALRERGARLSAGMPMKRENARRSFVAANGQERATAMKANGTVGFLKGAVLASALTTVVGIGTTALGETHVGGMIAADAHWTVENAPYIVVQHILVLDDATLVIDPGV